MEKYKKKKQAIVSWSSAEAFRAFGSVVCEIIWVVKIFGDLNVTLELPIKVFYDNKSAIQFTTNLVFHERTKHFEIDLYFIREKVLD